MVKWLWCWRMQLISCHSVNVDASLIRSSHRLTRTESKVVALQNGCICCTLRGDLLEELMRLSELAEFDYVIIESSGISEPEQVAETFDVRLAEQISAVGEGPEGLDASTVAMLRRLKEAGGLEKFARLDTTCTVIDAFTVFHDFETVDLISARRDDVTPEDERTVSDLMVDQIEFADVIVLNKIDAVDAASRESVRSLVRKLNHRAKIIECNYGKVPVAEIVNTGMFDIELAQTGYGWLQDLHAMTVREVNGRKAVTPKPETEEYANHIHENDLSITLLTHNQIQRPELCVCTSPTLPSSKTLRVHLRQVHSPASRG
jgi:G3E family GTPase